MKFKLLCVSFVAGFMILPQNVNAMGFVLKRIVFEGGTKSESILLTNNSDHERVYTVSWAPQKMTEDGRVISMTPDEVGQNPASQLEDLVVFSPRRVVVKPQSTQTIRLIVRNKYALPDGEYMAHLYVKSANTASKEKGVSLLPSIKIPVTVRLGNVQSSVTIDNFSVQSMGGKKIIKANFNRDGERSTFGKLELLCDGRNIYTQSAFAIYPNLKTRYLNREINNADNCSSYELIYKSDASDLQYKGDIIASKTINGA
jgi:hypothetical protein